MSQKDDPGTAAANVFSAARHVEGAPALTGADKMYVAADCRRHRITPTEVQHACDMLLKERGARDLIAKERFAWSRVRARILDERQGKERVEREKTEFQSKYEDLRPDTTMRQTRAKFEELPESMKKHLLKEASAVSFLGRGAVQMRAAVLLGEKLKAGEWTEELIQGAREDEKEGTANERE